MAIEAKVESIDRDVEVMLKEDLSPEAMSAMLADEARSQLKEAEEQDRNILGRIPSHKTTVDGVEDASEDKVRPSGEIFYEFDLVFNLFAWIADQLKVHAPVGAKGDPHPGRFRSSFSFYADGAEIDVGGKIPENADEYVFLSTVPYARKIERGESSQAPDGVFEVIAALAQQKFGATAQIRFSYRAPLSVTSISTRVRARRSRSAIERDSRVPAIIIRLK